MPLLRSKYASRSSRCFGVGSLANVSADASVSAPPIPRIVWDLLVGSTKTQICVSSGCPIGLKVSLSVSERRWSVLAAVVYTVISLPCTSSISGGSAERSSKVLSERPLFVRATAVADAERKSRRSIVMSREMWVLVVEYWFLEMGRSGDDRLVEWVRGD